MSEAAARETAIEALPAGLLSVADAPLTPLSFLLRSAVVWADRPAVVDAGGIVNYRQLLDRVQRAAGMLVDELGLLPGDCVATLLPNVRAMLELHYAVPGIDAVLVPLNTRLAASDYAYILEHSGTAVVIAFRPLQPVLDAALAELGEAAPRVVWVEESSRPSEYDALLDGAAPRDLSLPSDERALLSINYTSGTTGRPKGVMTSHRGAYLHSLGVIAEAQLTPRSAYLWTLPMFHCNGWAYTWAVTAMGAKHVCLEQVVPGDIWRALLRDGITHLCAAPTVVVSMLQAPESEPLQEPAQLFVGGAPPAPTLLERAAKLNIAVTHLYGLTETYGPIAVCAWNPDWDELPAADQARLRARQGVSTVVSRPLRVVDEQGRDVPRDGQSLGEVVMQGNNVMRGYFRDPQATETAFRGGWFHSGDLGVMHPDGYVELKDRLKDVIISGGENIATIEIEQALNAHPAVAEAAVVRRPDDRWGEVPVAFITLTSSSAPDIEELKAFLRERIARFKVPKDITVVEELPKTSTGKIQKFILRDRAAGR